METTLIILAAGQGTRMCSSLPKVLHHLAGRPLIWHSLQTAAALNSRQPVVVIGHSGEAVQKAVGEAARFVVQREQLGTGHAVQAAETLLQNEGGLLLVVSADMPLLKADTLQRLVDTQKTNDGPVTMLTVIADDPRGFGRVLRDENGTVKAIIEEPQATPEQRCIKELNVGAYCFAADWLWGALRRVPLSPKGEYYLTDVVGIAVEDGFTVQALTTSDPSEAIGINNRIHLAESEAIMRQRLLEELMLSGVTVIDPHNTYVEAGVDVGQDTVIWPNTHLRGETVIGESCSIGPGTLIVDSQLGNHCKVVASVIEQAVVEHHVDIGPYGHLRKGAHLAEGAHMGNFGEVKDSYLGPGVKMGHFSYIGNATIGEDVNIGAGTITCNFDGKNKNPTEIGAGAFIGSDTMLVAPLKIGEGAHTGAGAVVTQDVLPHEVVVGVPARPLKKRGNGE